MPVLEPLDQLTVATLIICFLQLLHSPEELTHVRINVHGVL